MTRDDMIDCSVVIPTWNAAAYVQDAIQSALSQSNVRLEVLIIDDASTDDTVQLVSKIEDPRVILIRRDRNGGAAAARNTGFRCAKGRWIAVLDADDTMEYNRLADLIALADKEEADIIADNLWVAENEDRTLHIKEVLDQTFEILTLKTIYSESIMFSGGKEYGYLKPLFARHFIERIQLTYDETLPIGEDFQFLADALAAGAKFVRVRQAGYVYSRRPGSLSHRMEIRHFEAIAAADENFVSKHKDSLKPDEREAVLLRRRSALNGADFMRIVEALKAQKFGAAFRLAGRHPAALPLFKLPIKDALHRLRHRIGAFPRNA